MILLKRAYDPASVSDGFRVLVDRLWPRGMTKEKARIDEWLRDLAPSDELRHWFHERPSQWTNFRKRYLAELRQPEASSALERLYEVANKRKKLTLVFASKNTDRNNAVVLKELLEGMRKPPSTSGPAAVAAAGRARRASAAKVILRPLASGAATATAVAAWDAIFPTQRSPANELWMIAQNDHARLAGEFAARMHASWLPPLGADAVSAIAIHDSGWEALDSGMFSHALQDGKQPVSFIDMEVADFLVAWTTSIDRAAENSPTGGLMVSTHFCRLAEWRLQRTEDPPETAAQVRAFLAREDARRERLLDTPSACAPGKVSVLTDVLQFCDVLSLFLCCGSKAPVEFPQRLGGRAISLWQEGGEFRFAPASTPLRAPLHLAIAATRWPDGSGTELSFHLQ